MAFAGFGKPKYGGNSFAKTVKPKEGAPIIARILPPMKSLAESGEWAVYHGIHYGYKGVNPKDPNKPLFRTFACIEERDFKTKMITQDCPECDLIAQYEEELKTIKANAERDQLNEEDTKELTSSHTSWLKEHNCDRKWHMNVKLKSGEFAVLTLSHKTKKNILEPLIAKLLSEEGIDALDPEQGVWFVITRTGKQLAATDAIEVEQEAVKENGRVIKTTKLAPLTEAEAEKALKECPDLAFNVTILTHQQIKSLTECSGEPESVDAIFALGSKRESSARPNNDTKTTSSQRPSAPPKQEEKKAEQTAPKQEEKKAEGSSGMSPAEMAAMIAKLTAQLQATTTAGKADEKAEESAPQQEQQPAPTSEKVAPMMSPNAGGAVDRAAFMARFRSK